MDAKKVFSEIIKYLQNQLMYSAGYGITMADIRFVITVPAIWTVHVKQFMREAAQKVIHQTFRNIFLSKLFSYLINKSTRINQNRLN